MANFYEPDPCGICFSSLGACVPIGQKKKTDASDGTRAYSRHYQKMYAVCADRPEATVFYHLQFTRLLFQKAEPGNL